MPNEWDNPDEFFDPDDVELFIYDPLDENKETEAIVFMTTQTNSLEVTGERQNNDISAMLNTNEWTTPPENETLVFLRDKFYNITAINTDSTNKTYTVTLEEE